MDDEVTSMVKEIKDDENNYGKSSAYVEKSTMKWLKCTRNMKKRGKINYWKEENTCWVGGGFGRWFVTLSNYI